MSRTPLGNDCGFRWTAEGADSPCGCARTPGHENFPEVWRNGVLILAPTPHLCTCGKTVESARNAS